MRRLRLLIATYFVFFCTAIHLLAQGNSAGVWSVFSPDQTLGITVIQPADGSLNDTVSHVVSGVAVDVIHPSHLGIVRDDQTFADHLVFDAAEPEVIIDETYQMVIGKQRALRNHAQELTLDFHNANHARLQLILRAYDDGVAFRYRFPEEDAAPHMVTQLFRADQHWILLTEANLDGSYFGAHLGPRPVDGEYAIAMPLAEEAQDVGSAEPTSTLPWTTPWRVIMVGQTIGTIVESSLAYHLSAPGRIDDTRWIHPGRVSWSWWSDHNSSQNFDSLTPFVDLAAEMGWEYSLVDANWNVITGGSLVQLADYARQRGVGLLVWYNSGGPHYHVTEQPRDLMFQPDIRRAEFARLEALGVRGVKVDFFQTGHFHR